MKAPFRVPDQLLLPWHPKHSISVTRAAEILDVSTDVIYRLLESGDIKGYQLRSRKETGSRRGSPWRINYDSFVEYVQKLHERSGLETRF
jgi:excisionase family DNA binding protein